MKLQVRKNKETGIQVEDCIVLDRKDEEEVLLAIVVRGSFDERPHAPKTTYWTYRADLYEFERIFVVLITEETREVSVVDGEWVYHNTKKEKHLLSQDGGTTWVQVKNIIVGEARPFSSVSSED